MVDLSSLHQILLLFAIFFPHETLSQDSVTTVVRPVRHSLHPGLQSLNGSSSNGGCTRVNGDVCELDVGHTSVLVDNTILPLSGLDGNQWARDLYTVERGATSFVSIGLDFGTLVQVRRVELVLFNCLQWSIGVGDIDIYADVVTNIFPRSDPLNVASAVRVGNLRLLNTTNSCENLYTICVPLTEVRVPTYYIVFPNVAGSDRVYLAETIFYNDSTSCGPDTLVTEPRPPGITTTNEGISTSIPTPVPPTDEEMSTTDTLSCPSTSVNTTVIALIVTVVVTTMLAVLIVVLHIPLYVRYNHLLASSTTQDVKKERPVSYEIPQNVTYYEEVDVNETGFVGETVVHTKHNEAYGLSQVTG